MFLKRQFFLFFFFQLHYPIIIMAKNNENFMNDEYDLNLLDGKTTENNLMVGYVNIIMKYIFL